MCGFTLKRQQFPLAFHTPAIARDRTVFPNHAMTRHNYRYRILAAGPRHRSHRRRLPDAPRHRAVRARLAARNLLQRLPHTPLKRRRAHIQRQRTTHWMLPQSIEHRSQIFSQCIVIPLQRRTREILFQSRLQLRIGQRVLNGHELRPQ